MFLDTEKFLETKTIRNITTISIQMFPVYSSCKISTDYKRNTITGKLRTAKIS